MQFEKKLKCLEMNILVLFIAHPCIHASTLLLLSLTWKRYAH